MQSLIHLLDSLTQWYWFGLAVILVILEVGLGANFFLLWLGASAASVGIIMLLYVNMPWEVQFLMFAVEAIACLVFWNLHLKHNPHISDQPNLNRRNEQYVGRVITLTEPVVNGRGRIHIDDSFWRIEGPDLPIGTQVKIVGVDGVVLKIKPS